MKRNHFRAPLGALTAVALACIAVACGGGGGSDDDDAGPATVVRGTVAVGAALANAAVTVKDSDAATADVTGSANAQGEYSLDVSSLRPPLVVSAAGTLNGEAVSIVAVVPALTAGADNTANVTSLTNAVAALVAPGGDVNALSSATAIAAVSAATVADASSLVVNTLRTNPAFASVLAADFSPLSTVFAANGSGIDGVIDQVQVEASTAGVTITNLAAPSGDSGQATVTLTAAQVANPTAPPTLPPSAPESDLPTNAQLAALAQKVQDCLALPVADRVTLNGSNRVTAVSATCNFGPAQWKSDGGGWVERVGQNFLRFDTFTGSRAGTPTLAAVLAAPNYSGTTFQHPYCNTQTCVIMTIPMTSASGRPWTSTWYVGRIGGEWTFVGNQLPYSMGVAHRLDRKVAVNTELAAANPTNYFLQDRFEAAVSLNFNPDESGAGNTNNIRAVVWKGPGLPAAGVVTHRSQRCATDDRFPITNQEGVLTVNNSSSIQFWNNIGGTSFYLDAAKLDGSALAMAVPTTGWATNAAPSNQDYRSTPFTGSVPAWSTYTAEIYYFTNTGTTPDEVIVVRNGTPYERASAGAAKNWAVPASSVVDQYLKPTGSGAGSLTSLAQTLSWTNPSGGYVSFAYLFSQNRVTATNSESETALYTKRSNLSFRPTYGDTSAGGFEWGGSGPSGTALSSYTASSGTNPNPRCTTDEVLPLDTDNTNRSYREVGLQSRGADRKLYQSIYFWSY
jgi:glucoamylase